VVTDPQTHPQTGWHSTVEFNVPLGTVQVNSEMGPQTGPITIHCTAALLARSETSMDNTILALINFHFTQV